MLSFYLVSFFSYSLFCFLRHLFLRDLRLRHAGVLALNFGQKNGTLCLFVHIAKRWGRRYGRIGKNAFVEKIENYSHNARNWRKGIAII